MFLRYLLVVLIGAFISSAVLISAKGTPLRDLAAANNFHVGAAVYTYHLDDPVHADTLSREFNMLTPENEAKFCVLQPQEGQFDFTKFDRLVDFAQQHNMVVRGHNLVWHQCLPDWVANGKFSQLQAIQLLRDHIMTVMGRYRGRVPIWDVVNEAEADDGSGLRAAPWRTLIGDNYVELAFRFAREADPNALLFYNDYGAEGLNHKSDAIYAMMQDFVKRGVPINGVGLQTHITVGDTGPSGQVNPDALAQNMQRLTDLGLQVQITEMDVAHKGPATDQILSAEAGDYHNVLSTCLNNKNCTAFITWGVSDKFSWLRYSGDPINPKAQPLLFDDTYVPKIAYFAVQDVLARRAGKPPVLSDQDLANIVPTPLPVIAIPKPAKSNPAQLAPDTVAGAVYYAPFPVKITLDGDESDWKNIPRGVVDKGPTIPADNTSMMTFAAAADNDNLYFLADVKDNNVVYGKHDPTTDWYKEDSVEFYINATGDLKLQSYQKGVSQMGILAANITHPAKPIIGGINGSDVPVNAVVVKTPDGYRVEASVPLKSKVWSIQPKNEGVIGFQVHLNGSAGDDRDLKLIWSAKDTQDQSYMNPSLFGQLIFWQVGSQQIEMAVPQY